MTEPERYPESVEWLIAIGIVAAFMFFGVGALAIILPAAAIYGFVHWGLGTRRRR